MFYKYILSPLILCSTLTLFSQELPYEFVTIVGQNYIPLSNADTLDTGGPWDDPMISVPIGFDFPLFGTTTTNTLYFNGLFGGYLVGNESQSPVLAPYGSDLTDRGLGTDTSQSPILYKVEGQAPNRIFKIEWQNAGFYNELIVGINESFVNCQMWLYEFNGSIEYCYGPSNIVAANNVHHFGHTGPVIGLGESINGFGSILEPFWFLVGAPEAAELDFTTSSLLEESVLTSTPASGTIYGFLPIELTAVQEKELIAGVQFYPNPVSDFLQVALKLDEVPEALEIRLFNSLGQEVYYQLLGQSIPSLISIDVEQLPKGSYTVQVRDGQAQFSKMIMKQ